MRLINTHTLEFVEFDFDNERPRYAALSHRWTDSELSYKDFAKGRCQDSSGYRKIVESCRVAKTRGLQWIWIDTVCIDKRSSAELSETINSMFAYYECASECYAYLSDVDTALAPAENDDGGVARSALHDPIASMMIQFRKSIWFTRGWTLQELIAPRRVFFFTKSSDLVGVKGPEHDDEDNGDEIHLESEIAAITGIPEDVLVGETHVSKKSVAQKMSWLATRLTTRREDMAYCVLGIFEVNLPLLYGEGARAWIRLQEEIIRKSNDETVFAWTPPTETSRSTFLLAQHPNAFRYSGQVKDCSAYQRPAYAITNQGLEFRFKARTAIEYYGTSWNRSKRLIIVVLNCTTDDHPSANGDVPFWVLTLVERSCGHFERLTCLPLPLASLADHLGPGSKLIEQDETVYIHTTAAVARGCWRRLRLHGDEFNMPAATGVHDEFVSSLNLSLQEFDARPVQQVQAQSDFVFGDVLEAHLGNTRL